MRDQDQEYPRHQPGRREQREHNDPFDGEARNERELAEAPRRSAGPLHQREVPTTPELPRGHVRKALLVGLIAGLLGILQNVIIVLANAAVFENARKYTTQGVPLGVAAPLFGIQCLSLFIGIIIYFSAGFIIGRVSVERRMGFIGGFVAGAVTIIVYAVLQQLPFYPNAGNTGFSGGFSGMSGGLVIGLILLIVLSALAGLVSLGGTWLATRKHPYYVGYEE